ncbi:TOR1 [Auxenochlorella protothecoides x Auxenochlorella symbiontica]
MKLDTLSRILAEICQPGFQERRDDHVLREFVDSEARNFTGERFNRFALEMNQRIKSLIRSNDVAERMGGLVAIEELAGSKMYSGSPARLADLVKLLMEVFQPASDQQLMEFAARTLGHTVKAGGALMAGVVEEQVKLGLSWLSDRAEYHRLAGTLVLHELAIAAPAVFNVHVKVFVEAIWNGIRDPKLHIRETAVAALQACLVLIEKRETRYRVQWYYRLFEQTKAGLARAAPVEIVHGSLLALGELVRHTGEFMLARYREVCETVLRFRDSKEKLIRRAIITLLPRLAAFAPERFTKSYLDSATEHLLAVLGSPADRGAGFAAIAEMSTSLSSAGVASKLRRGDYLRPIALHIRDALLGQSKTKAPCSEALHCAGTLAVALGRDWQPYIPLLLEPMFQTGLSESLVHALHQITRALPDLLPRVQELLLDLLSLVLARRTHGALTPPATVAALQAALAVGELQGQALTRMALQTFAQFRFAPHSLLEFIRDHVVPCLDNGEASIRRAAVLAACHGVEDHVEYGRRDGRRIHSSQLRIVDKIVQRLLTSAVSDLAVSVRKAVLQAFVKARSLASSLAQSEALGILFIALNDESSGVRSLTLQLAGSLGAVNPAFVMPALRRHLLQLLSDMECAPDTRQREDSAKLLGVLIGAAPKLVLPYTSPILACLVTQLGADRGAPGHDPGAAGHEGRLVGSSPSLHSLAGRGSTHGAGARALPPPKGGSAAAKGARPDDGFELFVLMTLGELARVAGSRLQPEVGKVLPLIIAAIQEDGSAAKRLVAVNTLGQVVENTGCVLEPYRMFPQLLGILLRMLNEGGPIVKREVMKVLGIMGALDPHIHKLNLAELQGEGKLEAEGVRPQTREQDAINAANLPVGDQGLDLLPSAGLVTSSEDYYPTVAINALMRLLRNPGLSALHGRAVAALFDIIKSMGFNFVLYLPKVVPVLLQLTRGADDLQRRVDMVRALTDLVSIMRQHISRFLKDFLDLVHEFWRGAPVMQPYLLTLLGELSHTLQDDFHTYMPDLLPMFVAVFDDAERTGDFAMIKPALEAIRSLGTVLESSLQLLLPVLVRLITPGASAAPLAVQEETLVTMQEVLPKMQLAGYSSAILHPLTRLLDSSSEELRERALDTICAVALAVGPDFAVFVPVIKKAVARHRMPPHAAFLRIAGKLQQQDPPCMSDAEDWEHSSGFLAEEHLARYLNTPGRYAYEAAPVSQTSADEGLYDTIGGQRNGGRHDGVGNLRRAWESSQRSTKDDWAEWMRNFSIELLKQSPSKALRACASLSQANPAMARELFAAGFVSCWSELEESLQDQLVRSLEAALASPTIPPDIVTTLLNLAEFMEHDEKALPLDTRTLGALAEKCHAYAKALHYKELEYNTSPSTAIEALISINNHLRQPDAAVGILTAAQKTKEMTLKESWYEKLQRWDEALRAYRKRLETTKPGSPENIEALLGECRCLAALAEWEELYSVCRREWQKMEPQTRRELAPVAAHAAWQLGEWKCMEDYVDVIKHQQAGSSEGAFLSAVLHVKKEDYTAAMVDVDQARELLGTELSALVGESYERAYGDMVRVQQLTELEDILTFKLAEQVTKGNPAIMTHTKNFTQAMWAGRMQGVQRNVEVWQALLSVRGLLLDMHEDTATWLKFASLCRKSGRRRQSEAALQRLLQDTRASARARGLDRFHPDNREADVLFAWHKHQWATGPRQEAFMGVQELAQHLGAAQDLRRGAGGEDPGRLLLAAKVHMKLGLWRRALTENLSQNSISSVLANLKAATEFAPDFGKIWHHWALFNVEAMGFYSKHDPSAAQRFVAPAIIGFFRSIELGQAPPETQRMGQAVRSSLQDILRLLTLWFQHGAAPDVEAALADGFSHVNIDTWLVVIPQVIARIHTNSYPVRRLIHSLLVRIGRFHPQALMYPLLVACKSQSVARRAAAVSVMDNVRQHSATLVEQAQLVSQELIRMAVLWHEQWHESLEEASRLYFGESNVDGMLDTLLPLHEMMKENGPSTLQEIAFVQAYGRELDEAYEWCLKFKQSRREAELHQAWDLYYHVFRKINKQLPSLSVLELQYVAPALVRAKNLELAVPGTYIVGEAMVTIGSFRSQLHVITSKQRPRKLTILGSDGAEYMFLLKGHEDLRQDERVMQLFGLVNNMLANDRVTAERDLSIARYAVIPLSPNSGLIGWVPNTDTLHSLIREYRDARKIPLNVEHRLMLGMAPDYDHLTVIQKVEVFEHSLNSTSGEDLHKVLWLKSRSSEAWLDKRTNYTRSTAVMSMVGYILGLGDRHPSNLMLDRYSGKLLHIDFGDCFEASMQREKFPERVPFRLTRMMIKAFEISGIEGNFRATCNEVLRVLRSEKDSVMAMLEAFVHDPLINWRLLNANDGAAFEAAAAPDGELPPSPPMRESSRQEALASVPGDAAEALNERAVVVMKRLSEKLTGRDSGQDDRDADTVSQQVQRLIAQATSAENLSVMYIGWCAFW